VKVKRNEVKLILTDSQFLILPGNYLIFSRIVSKDLFKELITVSLGLSCEFLINYFELSVFREFIKVLVNF
jgi:hypothetical protein